MAALGTGVGNAQAFQIVLSKTNRAPEPVGATRDRALGALVGLAVGDAAGTTLEFTEKPPYAVLGDMVGGGPFCIKPGQWTDDTAMALALADSRLADPELDTADLMTRFGGWHLSGFKIKCGNKTLSLTDPR